MLEDRHHLLNYAEGKFDEAVHAFRRSGGAGIGPDDHWTNLLVAMMRLQQVSQSVKDLEAADKAIEEACLKLTNLGSWQELLDLTGEV